MRIAITIWKDKISPVLDTASKLLIMIRYLRKNLSFKFGQFRTNMYKRYSLMRKLELDFDLRWCLTPIIRDTH